MTLDEAIKELQSYLNTWEPLYMPERGQALRLDIEALKRYRAYQVQGETHSGLLLPGETEE